MRLSVIIPGCNTPEKLWRRCLESVRMACGPEDEIICVDDGSRIYPRFLREIANKDSRVKPVFLTSNSGQSVARNSALDIARGEWVTFVDSDDEVVPGILEKGIARGEFLSRDIVTFGFKTIWQDEGLERSSNVPDEDFGVLEAEDMKRFLDGSYFEVVWNKIYRRSWLVKNGIRFPEGICPGEDTMFNLMCVIQGAKWCGVSQVGYIYYRKGTTSLSSYMPNLVNTLECWKERWDKYRNSIGKGYDGWWPTRDYSQEWVAKRQWDNIWMRGSPLSMHEKWQYLSQHPELAQYGMVLTFAGKSIYTFLRRYFYTRQLRRWHLKRLWPDIRTVDKN